MTPAPLPAAAVRGVAGPVSAALPVPALPLQSGTVAVPAGAQPAIVVAPVLVALVTAVLTLLARPVPRAMRAVSVLGAVGYAAAVGALVARVFGLLGGAGGAGSGAGAGAAPAGPVTLTYQVSYWVAPLGISAVADPLSAFMLALAAAVAVPALVYSVLYVDAFGQRLSYHPLYHFMVVGVSGAFLTGDVFNLFVWFEVMLMSSYVLVVFYSGPQHTRAALQYVVLNLVASALMLVAIGGLYATTGTLNMADMARRLANPAAFGVDPAPVLGVAAILFVVFALKAGVVPFHFWVPGAYRAAPAPVAAVLAGVVKKVGIYAVVRLYFTVFSAADLSVSLPGVAGSSMLDFFGPVMFATAVASIFLGGVAAVGREDFDGLLAYSSVGQIGFVVLPLAVAAAAADPAAGAVADPAGPFDSLRALGVAAALVYSLNHALAKGVLFLASGTVGEAVGSTDFDAMGGLAERAPLLSASVFVGGIALVGVPPVLGFFGKFLVFDTALRAGSNLGLAATLGGAVLTIAYVTSLWNRGFRGAPGDEEPSGPGPDPDPGRDAAAPPDAGTGTGAVADGGDPVPDGGGAGDDSPAAGDGPATDGDDPAADGDDPATAGDDPATDGDDPATDGDDPATDGGADSAAAGDPTAADGGHGADATHDERHPPLPPLPLPRGEVAVIALFALALLAVGVAFDPVFEAARAAAEAAVDRPGYVDAVDPQRYDGPGTGSKKAAKRIGDVLRVAGTGAAVVAGVDSMVAGVVTAAASVDTIVAGAVAAAGVVAAASVDTVVAGVVAAVAAASGSGPVAPGVGAGTLVRALPAGSPDLPGAVFGAVVAAAERLAGWWP